MAGLRSRAAGIPIIVASALSFLASVAAAPQQTPALPTAPPTSVETLTYAIEWRLIPAGTARYTWTQIPNTTTGASEVRLHLESAGLVSRLFRVNDEYTAELGQNFCAQSTFLVAHEGNRNKETRVVYDAQARKASYVEKDLNKNATVNHDVEIPPCVHDVIGGLMFLRNLRLEPGKTAQIPLSDGKKFVQARVESQRREDLKTNLGTLKTIRYEIFLFDNVLFRRAGHLHVWLTDDDRRLPVQLQVRLQFTIGTITFMLAKEEKQ